MRTQGVLTSTPPFLKSADEVYVYLGPILAESGSFNSSVTSHAVEDGDAVSDHVKPSPDTFSIKTKLVDFNETDRSSLSQARRLMVDKLTVKDKLDLLKTWRKSGALLTYNGPIFSSFNSRAYDMTATDIVITSLQEARVDSIIEVSLSFQKVTIATSMTREIDLPQAAKTTKNKGQTEKKKTEVAKNSKSIFSRIFGGS